MRLHYFLICSRHHPPPPLFLSRPPLRLPLGPHPLLQARNRPRRRLLLRRPPFLLGARAARPLRISPHCLPLVSRLSSLFLPFAFGLLAALALVLVPLSIVLGSFPQALRHGLLKLYLDCFNPALTSLPYFKEVMGTDAILPHVLRLFLGAALAVSPFLLARCLLPRLSSRPLRLAATVLLAFASAALGWFAFFPLNAALPLAPVAFLAILWGRRRPAFVEGSRASPVLCRFLPFPPPSPSSPSSSSPKSPSMLASDITASSSPSRHSLAPSSSHFRPRSPPFACSLPPPSSPGFPPSHST